MEARLIGIANAFSEKEQRQRRSDGERDAERSHDRQNVAQCQRREELALQTGEGEHGQKNQRDDEGGVNDGAANFERGVEHHVEERARVRQQLIFAKTAEDVFDVDDRVVDNFTDGDGEPAEGDGVERDAELVQQDDRREQRQGNSGD